MVVRSVVQYIRTMTGSRGDSEYHNRRRCQLRFLENSFLTCIILIKTDLVFSRYYPRFCSHREIIVTDMHRVFNQKNEFCGELPYIFTHVYFLGLAALSQNKSIYF